ncbi:MAG: hypothetical protein QOG63_1921 [Thermoleophilaceae bacterium]|nr:hypothetical protein [Thermoleophilaceae bacterium]
MIEVIEADGEYGTDSVAPADLAAAERQLEIAGCRLNFVEAGDGETCFLLLHGMGGRWQHWLPTIAFLARRGRVIALDVPGFGSSDPLTGTASPEAFADVAAELCRRRGARRVVFLGHSMGGPIAAHFASRHRDVACAIVLVAGAVLQFSSLLGFRKVLHYARRRPRATAAIYCEIATSVLPAPRLLRRLIARVPLLRRAVLWPYLWRPQDVSPALATLLVDGAGAPGVLRTARAIGRSSPRAAMTYVTCPVLSIGARHDLIAPVADLEQFDSEFPEVRSVLIEGSGHMVMLERPTAFNDCLAGFLDTLPAADAEARRAAG